MCKPQRKISENDGISISQPAYSCSFPAKKLTSELCVTKNSCFERNLSPVVLTILVRVPNVQMTFSKSKIIESYKRNSLGQKRTNSLVVLAVKNNRQPKRTLNNSQVILQTRRQSRSFIQIRNN